jgi:hypothetical protein
VVVGLVPQESIFKVDTSTLNKILIFLKMMTDSTIQVLGLIIMLTNKLALRLARSQKDYNILAPKLRDLI